MSLECAPMKHCRFPVYPTRLEILADPDLLKRHIPATWLSRGEMAGLLSVFLAVNGTGCSKDQPAASSTRPAGSDLAGKAAIVAPIFEHGDGRGAVGCVVTNPPVFLSEEEALQVITEELAQAGLVLPQRNTQMEGVAIPPRKYEFQLDWVSGEPRSTLVVLSNKSKPLDLDLRDPAKGVAIEFVSASDYISLGGPASGSSVQGLDFKDVAGWVGKNVQEQGRGLHAAVFYDPAARPTSDRQPGSWKQRSEDSKNESKRLLRLQVKDFVDWLKGQGVI
ncbi:MAG: hypothetical protein GX616_01135 [Planctomycetes bacterium]|nr:hypothetical protein [Planctomycetota bacterium]